ncbi:glycosyltransferase family 4 protein [Methanococcus voltae]|uniref:Glycosyl transferase group 1 n=1 Tax=Methanococcus voltae (strain ATCC BAA-1334 / A3) TaxID=456320 RepID=D7DQH1_METV3|nr:glycosyltransferase family 4 protein [Methanococcus voltae]MCS3901667.1 glycosyltransferase involved in cell wall biosynthesis [Methanococcus voltae]
MKILIPTIYHPYPGGISTHVENLIKNINLIIQENKKENDDLTYKKIEFHILNYKKTENMEKIDFDKKKKNQNDIKNVIIHEIPFIKKLRGPTYFLNGYKEGSKIIEDNDINLIHSHYAFPQGFLGAKLSNKYKIPHILTLHGSDVMKLSKNPVGKPFFKYAIKNSTGIICISKYLKKEIQNEQNILKITQLYNGINLELFNNKNISDENYGLYVGAFVGQKGINTLINSIIQINQQIGTKNNFKYKLVGSGKKINEIKELIKKNNLNNIEILGQKSQFEVSELIKKCSFLVLPSNSEGMGIVLLEAMACQKPVIGTSIGGIPELITENYNGYIVKSGDSDSLANSILKLIENPKIRAEFGNNGYILSKKYSWKNNAEETLKLYHKLTNCKVNEKL